MRAARERLKNKIVSHLHLTSRAESRDERDDRDTRIRSGTSTDNDQVPPEDFEIAVNSLTCVTCLKNAINPAQQGPKIRDLWAATHAGCVRCAAIVRGLEKFKHFYEPEMDQDPLQHKVQVHFVSPNINVSTMGVNLRTNRVYAKRYEFCYNIDKGMLNPLPDLLVPQGVMPNSRSDACFDSIKEWTDVCEANHVRCKTRMTAETCAWLPSRLIHVHDVRIVLKAEINGPATRYAALSHCWGTPEENVKALPRTLNKVPTECLEVRRKHIPWDSLTTNFQDAIIIARKLGYDYMWIDSLCIIQDDRHDWAVEAAAMAQVYGNANIVISATRSASGDGGLFNTRKGAVEVKIPELDDLAITIRPRPKHANFFTSHKPDFTQDPVFERGWCFQERLLAKRIIHFTEQELVWECSEDLQCECGTIGTEAVYRREGNHDKQFKTRFDTLLHSDDPWEQNSCWLNILEGYTARKLTKESDRLPALSGIAQKLASPQRGRYFAGHWENTLPNSLLWYLPFGNSKARQAIERLPNIPTWAWPSVATAITPHFQNSLKHLSLTTVSRIVDAHCDLATSNPFGEIDGGYIVLEGPVKEVILRSNEVEGMKTLVDQDNVANKSRFLPDSYKDLPPDGSKVSIIGIEFDTSEGRTNGFLCLVLRKSEQNGFDHRRIGQANCLSAWFKSASTRIVHIA